MTETMTNNEQTAFNYDPEQAAIRVEEIQQSGKYSMDALKEAISKFLKSMGIDSPAAETPQAEQQGETEQQGEEETTGRNNEWFEQFPKRRDDLSINVIGPQSEQFIRILKSEHPELDVNASVVQWDVVNAAFESGVLEDNKGLGSKVDYDALKELSTNRWTREGVTQWTHISDLPEDDIHYLRDLLIQEGKLDPKNVEAGMEELKKPDSDFRKAATEYGLISSDGSLRPTTLEERDRAYLEHTFLNMAPIQVAREQAEAAVKENKTKVIDSSDAEKPESPAPSATVNQKQETQERTSERATG